MSTKPFDALISHSVDLSRYSNAVAARIVALLETVNTDLAAAIASALNRLPAESFTVQRLEALLADVYSMQSAAFERAFKALTDELARYAPVEAAFQRGLFELAGAPKVAALNVSQLITAAYSQPFRGRLLREWASSIEANRLARVRDTIRIGYAENRTTQQIVQTLFGTKANNFEDGVLAIDRRNVEAVARTALSHMANVTRERFYAENDDIIEYKVWVSTLDTRTTPQCQVRDGLEYTPDNKPIGHSVPWLSGPGQLHWNCRSTSMPVSFNAQKMGLDPRSGTRASDRGQVPAKLSYKDWLLRQSAARQDDILGPTRGMLLRKGELDVNRFWNDRGRYLTLDELRERDSAAFERAEL